MSLRIDVDTVESVLLADGWHRVVDKSLAIDAYEYMHEGETVVGDGTVSGVPQTGFIFKTMRESNKEWMCGPLAAILAVRGEKLR